MPSFVWIPICLLFQMFLNSHDSHCSCNSSFDLCTAVVVTWQRAAQIHEHWDILRFVAAKYQVLSLPLTIFLFRRCWSQVLLPCLLHLLFSSCLVTCLCTPTVDQYHPWIWGFEYDALYWNSRAIVLYPIHNFFKVRYECRRRYRITLSCAHCRFKPFS